MQADRRLYVRRQEPLSVRVLDGRQERSGLATNVSATGAFISGIKQPEVDAEITLVIRPSGEHMAPVQLKCVVVHVIGAGGYAPGYGVRFIEASCQAGGKGIYHIFRKFLRIAHLKPEDFETTGPTTFQFPEKGERFDAQRPQVQEREVPRKRHASSSMFRARGGTPNPESNNGPARSTMPMASGIASAEPAQPPVVSDKVAGSPIHRSTAQLRQEPDPSNLVQPPEPSLSASSEDAPQQQSGPPPTEPQSVAQSVSARRSSTRSVFSPPPKSSRRISQRQDATSAETSAQPPQATAGAALPALVPKEPAPQVEPGAALPALVPKEPAPQAAPQARALPARISTVSPAPGFEPRSNEISQIVSPFVDKDSSRRRSSGGTGWSTYQTDSDKPRSRSERRQSTVVADDPFAAGMKRATAERMKADKAKRDRRLSEIQSANKQAGAKSNRFFGGDEISTSTRENSIIVAASEAVSSINGQMLTGSNNHRKLIQNAASAASISLPVSYVLDGIVHEAQLVTLSPMVIELLSPNPVPELEQRFEVNLPMEQEGVWMPICLYGKLLRVPDQRDEQNSLTVHIERVREPDGFEGSYSRFCGEAERQ